MRFKETAYLGKYGAFFAVIAKPRLPFERTVLGRGTQGAAAGDNSAAGKRENPTRQTVGDIDRAAGMCLSRLRAIHPSLRFASGPHSLHPTRASKRAVLA